MKTYYADEGMVFKIGEQVLGSIFYAPDNFDDTHLEQIEIEEEGE